MGLDITALSRIKPLRDHEPGEGYPGYLTKFHVADKFGRAPEIDGNKLYFAVATLHFPAGSYSGYGAWRRALAVMAGYQSAEAVQANPQPGPFVELIHFSDCEGTIGAAVAAKLAKDFAEFDEIAKLAPGGEGFYNLYSDFRLAFELASRDGAVAFR